MLARQVCISLVIALELVGIPSTGANGPGVLGVFGAAPEMAVAAPAPISPRPTRRITEIERYVSDDAARIVVHLTGAVPFQQGHSSVRSGPGAHLYVELEGAAYSGERSFEMEGLIDRVRVRRVGSAERVVLDASEPVRHSAFYLPSPFRVVIDVSRRVADETPAAAGRGVSRIALDPGHGGADPGATGVAGVREKDVVLDIAHRAGPLLARELGVSTVLTRDVDARVPLEERVARANAFGADLFVSIHCNASRSARARGVMTFVLDASRDEHAATVAERENGAAQSTGEQLQLFLRQFENSAMAQRSSTFARLLQRATLASLAAGYPDSVDGGVHGAGFYVLAGAQMPAVLFETSFVSNEVEEARLGTGRYRQKLADGIVNAVRAYRAGY